MVMRRHRIFTRCLVCFRKQLMNTTLLKRRHSSSLHQECDVQLRKPRIKSFLPQNDEDKKVCIAYCTSESYIFDDLRRYFIRGSSNYTLGCLPKDVTDVLYVKKQTTNKSGDIFVFRRLGAFVCWDIPGNEILKLRQIFSDHQLGPYPQDIVDGDNEVLNYSTITDKPTHLADGDIFINTNAKEDTLVLEKLAFSNAMALSVKLNMWESSLDTFSLSLRYIPEVLRRGLKVKMTRNEVLQKIGELLTLRHQINLYSDLLTTPDFYWDREELEKLYTRTCTYLEVSKRTKVMNEKLNLCSELVEMLRSHLNDQHSHRLEWMIIILITIEVLFETIHLAERWL